MSEEELPPIKCEFCGKTMEQEQYIVRITWEDVGRETGLPLEEDLYFGVCSIKCGIELLRRCYTKGKPIDADFLEKAEEICIYEKY